MYGRNSQSTGRQGSNFRTPYNVAQQGRGVYGVPPCIVTQSATGGIQTMARPEQRWSLGHQESQPQQRGMSGRSQSSPGVNYQNQAQISYYPPPNQPQQMTYQQQPQQQAVNYNRQGQGQGQQQPLPATTVYAGNPFGSGGTPQNTVGIPPELEGNPNVSYVRMNWEDVLGGKDGLAGLKVSMAPPSGDGQNRQIRIGMGGQGQPDDGSTPLKIVSFQPVENYPGQMTGGASGQQQQPNYGNNGGGGAMPQVSIGNPIMLPSQSNASTYMPQQRSVPFIRGGTRGVGEGMPSAGGSRYPAAPAMQMGNNFRRSGNRTSAHKCGNANCAACQFQQPYSQPRRR